MPGPIENLPLNLISLKTSLSYLAFLKVFTQNSILSYAVRPTADFYREENQTTEMVALLEQLQKLATEFPEFQPLGQIHKVEFVISKFELQDFTRKLLQDNLAELRNWGQTLAQSLSMPTAPYVPNATEALPETKLTAGFTLIDLDKDFENKLLAMPRLLQGQIEKKESLEKLVMTTQEQKEKQLTKVLQSPAGLPRLLWQQTFGLVQVVNSFYKLQSLITCPLIKIAFSPFTTLHGYSLNTSLVQSPRYPEILTALEQVKKLFTDTGTPYILPRLFIQRALVSLDLFALTIFKHQKMPLILELNDFLKKNFPYLESFYSTP